MQPKPCLISGDDLWREVYNDAKAPEKLLCDRLGCRMTDAPNEPGDDSEPLQEPSVPSGWWLVGWPEGSNANRFDESAEYHLVADHDEPHWDDTERYQPLTEIDSLGDYKLLRGFRHWRVLRGSEAFLQWSRFDTEEEARAFLATKE